MHTRVDRKLYQEEKTKRDKSRMSPNLDGGGGGGGVVKPGMKQGGIGPSPLGQSVTKGKPLEAPKVRIA